MGTKKIVAITGTRAEWDLLSPIVKTINELLKGSEGEDVRWLDNIYYRYRNGYAIPKPLRLLLDFLSWLASRLQ
jgi:hypothetical protein